MKVHCKTCGGTGIVGLEDDDPCCPDCDGDGEVQAAMCDCCNVRPWKNHVWAYGVETYACDQCMMIPIDR